MKTLILTQPLQVNYGGLLQAYALQQVLKRMGHEVWTENRIAPVKKSPIDALKRLNIVRRMVGKRPAYYPTREEWTAIARHMDAFVEQHITVTPPVRSADKRELEGMHFDAYVVGSDQVWCSTTLYPDPMMYLRFAPKNKRIAYAPSLGRDYIPGYNKKILKTFINDIPCLSVREDDGSRLIKELTGRDALVVADPTLLLTSTDWDKLKIEIETSEDYLLCYFLDVPSDDIKTNICKYASQEGKDIVVLGKLNDLDYPKDKIHYPIAGPGEFLFLISNASMVITDSYHGMLFSIIYHKKFWSVERAYSQFDQSSRQRTILSRLDLEDRYLKSDFRFSDMAIEYTRVQVKIEQFVALSMNYLKQSLEQ